MAANKFATILHRNTHWLIFLLIYIVLEWILIILLLLNDVLSYMISKFASFFGLKPPCIFCSRIDHIFEPGRSPSSCIYLLCESHAGEVSLLSWMKRSEQGKKDLRCSCCGVGLESGFYSPYLLFKADSWDVLEFAPRDKSEKEKGFGLKKMVQGKELKDEEMEQEEELKCGAFPPSPPFVVEDALVDIIPFHDDKRRESGTESLDGSFASDRDNLEPVTIDRLKTALKSERKAFIPLYMLINFGTKM